MSKTQKLAPASPTRNALRHEFKVLKEELSRIRSTSDIERLSSDYVRLDQLKFQLGLKVKPPSVFGKQLRRFDEHSWHRRYGTLWVWVVVTETDKPSYVEWKVGDRKGRCATYDQAGQLIETKLIEIHWDLHEEYQRWRQGY